jgi:Alginate export
MRLFVAEDKDIGIRPERLLREIGEVEFTRKHQCSPRTLRGFEQSEFADDWRDLMRLYLVRRTRTFIRDKRVIPEACLTLGSHFRLFASFQYEKEMGNDAGPRPGIDEDEGDFHEAFVDISTGLDDQRSVTLRLGQQELVYGTGRLVDNNEGVNVKSSFYGARIIAHTERSALKYSVSSQPNKTPARSMTVRPRSKHFGEHTEPCRCLSSINKARPTFITSD